MNTILLVDDDISTCETLSDILGLHDFKVLLSHDGAEAVEIANKNSVDAVLLDIRLPDIDGLELMRKIRLKHQDLIFIFMTGYASVDYTKKAYEQGASGFFVKPVLIEEAIFIIKEALEKRELAKEYARAEEERRVALAEFENLYNNSPDLYATVDMESRVINQSNDTLLAKLGYQREEVVGKHMRILYHPECLKIVEQQVWQDLSRFKKISNQELTLLKKNGQPLYVILNGSVPKENRQRRLVTQLVWHDITERKKLEEHLLVSEKMTIIAGLAAGVAHEINTPLSGILQSTQLLEMGFDPAVPSNQKTAEKHGLDLVGLSEYIKDKELDYFMSGIKDSAVTAARIVSDLLQFSRPHECEWTLSNLKVVIDRAVALVKSDYHLKKQYNISNVTFSFEYSASFPEVKCIAMEIEQVIINLIKNSCQAMVDGDVSAKSPQITIRGSQEQDHVVIELIDNGPGIPQEISHQIFDPFFTTKEVGVGTGLGLSVSYSIICVNHGGKMKVESIPNKATCIKILLPVNQNTIGSE